MSEFRYSVDTAMPVPEKAKELGFEQYADYAWRNLTVTITVAVPDMLVEYNRVQMPESDRIAEDLEFRVDANAPENEIQISVDRPDMEAFLEVDRSEADDEGFVTVTVSLPPPVAVVKTRINIPRKCMGYATSNAAVFVEADNIVALTPPKQRKRGRSRSYNETSQNWVLRRMNPKWFMHWVNRPDYDPESLDVLEREQEAAKFGGTHFWPAGCSLHVLVSRDMEKYPQDLYKMQKGGKGQKVYTPKHVEVAGSHPNLIESVMEERFVIYRVPETVPYADRSSKEFFTTRLADLCQSMDDNRLSDSVSQEGMFLPLSDKPQAFYCCFGVTNPTKRQTFVSAACFGQTQPLYQIDFRTHAIRVNEDGEKVLNRKKGHLVIIPHAVARQAQGALMAAFENGGMDQFYHDNCLIIPREAFIDEDEKLRSDLKKARQAAKAAKRAKPEAAGVMEEDNGGAEGDEMPIAFGDNSDILGRAMQQDPDDEDAEEPDDESNPGDDSASDYADDDEEEDDSA